VLAVSGHTGAGLPRLREAIVELTRRLPEPDRRQDIRLWVDRTFTVRGAGTVVTGTLAGGVLHSGDELALAATGDRVRVRGLQTLGEDAASVEAVARVAVNLRGLDRARLGRGDALVTPGAWPAATELDVRLRGALAPAAAELHQHLVLHRLTLSSALPLRVGDRGLLRDPGEHRIPAGIEVLDVRPPALNRRGAATARAAELEATGTEPDLLAGALVRRHGFVRAGELVAMGLPVTGRRVGAWVADEQRWAGLAQRAREEFARWRAHDPVAAGMPVEALRRHLDLPAPELVPAVLEGTGLRVEGGLVVLPGGGLPAAVERALDRLRRGFAEHPFRAPEADELAALRLGARELAAAVRAGRLSRIADGVVLGPDAPDRAAAVLATIAQPFTVSEARRALGTTRRVAVPLLERLDGDGVTEPLGDGRRRHTGKVPK
jgi:selenocysteine-specific elongation factor